MYGQQSRDSVTITPPDGYYVAEVNPVFKKFKVCPKCLGKGQIETMKKDVDSTNAEEYKAYESCFYCDQTGYLKVRSGR